MQKFICLWQIAWVHCKKDFPVPSRDVNNQTLPGRELIILARDSLVSDIRAEDWKLLTFFYSVGATIASGHCTK